MLSAILSALALQSPLPQAHRGEGAVVGRRGALLGFSALVATSALPRGADASYAMYAASQASFDERKKTGYVPVATSDKESLREIQSDIQRKRPQSALQLKKQPQYCAGQMSNVQPMMENICSNIGLSKADQSNTRKDEFGNMNVGAYVEQLDREKAAREAERLAARKQR
jgi:hypothetical protein